MIASGDHSTLVINNETSLISSSKQTPLDANWVLTESSKFIDSEEKDQKFEWATTRPASISPRLKQNVTQGARVPLFSDPSRESGIMLTSVLMTSSLCLNSRTLFDQEE